MSEITEISESQILTLSDFDKLTHNQREHCETPWLRLLPLLGDEYRQNVSEVRLLSLADESYPRHFYSASSATKEFRHFLNQPPSL